MKSSVRVSDETVADVAQAIVSASRALGGPVTVAEVYRVTDMAISHAATYQCVSILRQYWSPLVVHAPSAKRRGVGRPAARYDVRMFGGTDVRASVREALARRDGQ